MILTCKKCATSYSIADEALGPVGRKVKCIGCGHVWLQSTTGPVELADAAGAADQAMPLGKQPDARRPASGRIQGAASLVAMVAVVGGLVAAVHAGRAAVVQTWPPAALLYEEFGIGLDGIDLAAIPGVGAGLEYRNIASEVRADDFGDTLWVRGEVVNVSGVPRRVPTLRVSLTDANGETMESWTFSADAERLEPGAAVAFETRRRTTAALTAKLVLGIADPFTNER